MPKLKIIESGSERFLDLDDRVVTVGRGEPNTIPLESERASREHCRIEPVPGGGYKVVDAGSRNGTLVNGAHVAQKRLSRGDRIEVGGVILVFDPLPERAASPPAPPPAPAPAWPPAAPVAPRPTPIASDPPPKPTRAIPVEAPRVRVRARLEPQPAPSAPPAPTGDGRLRNAVFLVASATIAAVLTVVVLLPREASSPQPPSSDVAIAGDAATVEDPAGADAPEPLPEAPVDPEAPPAPELEPPASDPAAAPSKAVPASPASERRREPPSIAPAKAAADEPKPAAADSGHLKNLTKEGYYLLLQDAEDLARAHRYGEAIAAIAPAVPVCPYGDVREEMRGRATDFELRRALLDAIIEQARERPVGFMVDGMGAARGVHRDGVDLASGVRVGWSDVKPKAFVGLARQAALGARESLGLAAYGFASGLEDEAHRTLEALLRTSPESKREIDALLSRHLYIEVPPGGFVVHEHRFVSPEKRDQLLREAEMASLASRVASARGEERRAASERLRGFGEPGEKLLASALIERKTELGGKLAENSVTRKLDAMERDREKLDKLRESALALIFDEVKYPYPYRPPKAPPEITRLYNETQQEIDRRLGILRDHWRAIESRSVALGPSFASLVSDWREVSALLEALGRDFVPPNLPACLPYLNLAAKEVSARTCYRNDAEAEQDRITAAALRRNASLESKIRRDEFEQVRVTNEYRVMMGRRALAINEKLMRSARKHSDEMSRQGYFSHESPVAENATVQKRARNAGYEGSDVAENLAEGGLSPQSAHESWLHSSGHHRNILSERWTEMGVGNSGNKWTQNFGFRSDFLKELFAQQ